MNEVKTDGVVGGKNVGGVNDDAKKGRRCCVMLLEDGISDLE